MSLSEQLNEMHDKINSNVPEAAAKFDADTTSFLESGLAPKGLEVGDHLPNFALPNQVGKVVSSSGLLSEGHLVISFYRGSWCPYCNLELNALQQILPEIQSLGANLVTISPQLPDESMSTAEKNNLTFAVLSDVGNVVARKFELVFTLTEELRPLYKEFGIDLEKSNGDDSFELPVPATFVVDSSGIIVTAFVNADYKQRMEPEEIINALKMINHG